MSGLRRVNLKVILPRDPNARGIVKRKHFTKTALVSEALYAHLFAASLEKRVYKQYYAYLNNLVREHKAKELKEEARKAEARKAEAREAAERKAREERKRKAVERKPEPSKPAKRPHPGLPGHRSKWIEDDNAGKLKKEIQYHLSRLARLTKEQQIKETQYKREKYNKKLCR